MVKTTIRKSKKRVHEASKLLSISRKLRGADLIFLYENLKEETRNLLSEIIFNVLHNTSSLNLSSSHAKRLRKIILPHKKEFEFLAKRNGSNLKKMRILKKQIGGGAISLLVSTLAPIIISLLASSGKK